ncbi:MAG: 2-oxo acid dehydrogenase subunit E2 [SAR324 cluster bacterium]|nr:2-oxo acid dehydrogenase subunit E2 [SAR324 cluster bacterium]
MKVLQEIIIPQETVNDEFATIIKLYFPNGQKIKQGDTLVDFESSKAVVSIVAEQDGYITYDCQEGEEVPIGKVVAKITDTSDVAQLIDNQTQDVSQHSEIRTIFSKEAQHLVQQHKLRSELFNGQAFVSRKDVEKNLGLSPTVPVKIQKELPKALNVDLSRVELKKVTASKRTEINWLSSVQSANLNSVLYITVETEGIFDFTKNSLLYLKESLLPLISYESSRLLLKYRELNAFFVDDQIAYYKEIHLGIAVDLEDGLKVLTIPHADQKNLLALEEEIFNQVNKYIDQKLEATDITGSTFTITDLSADGVSFFSPLINKDQSAILGIASIDTKLNQCVLSLVFDHRVTTGKQVSNFLSQLKTRLESYRYTPNNDLIQNQTPPIPLHQIQCCRCMKGLEEDAAMDGPGMIKLFDHQGKEKFICWVCLNGSNL